MSFQRITALLFALAFACCVSAQESKPTIRHHQVAETEPEDPASQQIAQAEDAMQKGDFPAAEALLQKAVAAKPDDYRAWFDLGYIYAHSNNRLQQAIDAYRKSIAAKPDVFESNLNLGMLLAGSNRDGAAQYFKAATQLKPTQHPQESMMKAWMGLGRAQEGTEPTQALLAFAEAEKLDPKDPAPHIAAGQLYELHDCRTCPQVTTEARLNSAIQEYTAALAIDPTSRDALGGLERIYERQKNYAALETVLRKLLELNPQDPSVRLNLSKALSAQGKNDEAAEQLKAAHQANPNDPYAALELGTFYVKSDKNTEAEQQFRIAVRGLPQDSDAHYSLGTLLMYEKKYPEAQQELLLAVKLKPDLADAYGNLAIVAAANKDYPLSLQSLDARAKFLSETPATYFLRATNFDNLKAIPQAVENYQKFLAVDGGKFPDQEWQARHRLIAIDPRHADKYEVKK